MSLELEDCPASIGPWMPERLIGSGAVASVYLCVDDRGRFAAVKWLNHGTGPLVGRFLREVDSLRKRSSSKRATHGGEPDPKFSQVE